MTDTVRTTAALQALFADSAAPRSSTRQLMRDLIASFDRVKTRVACLTDPEYGLVDGGAIDAPFGAALSALPNGGIIFVPPTATRYLLNSMQSTPDGIPYLIAGAGSASQIKKNFNGDMFSAGALTEFRSLYMNGNGTSFTGRGVIVSSGSPGDTFAWRRFNDVDILDTASYCIEYTAANAGYFSTHIGCRFRVHNDATYTVKYNDAAETVGNRDMIGCIASSGPLLDLGGSQDSGIIGCQSGAAVVNDAVRFTANCKKARITGCRLTGGTDITVLGTDHTIVGNTLAMNITLGTGCAQAVVGPNNYSCIVTDSSGNSNNSVVEGAGFHTYSPSWTSSGTAPSLGNGSLTANWTRQARRIFIDLGWAPGSTTTFGTGNYFFSLPAGLPGGSGREYLGRWKGLNSGVVFEGGPVLITAGAPTVMTLFYENAIGNVTNTNPHTWKNGDTMTLQICYDL